MRLPPGPLRPAAIQTSEWIVAADGAAAPLPGPLRRAVHAARSHGRTRRWCSSPIPRTIKRVFAADPDVLRGGESSSVLEPFAGPRSILLLHGAEHLRQRRLMLPPFHGEALARWRDTIAALADAELDGWTPGGPVRALPRMQALTLEVILRVVFGAGDRRAARRDPPHARHDDVDAAARRDVAGAAAGRPVARRSCARCERLDALIYERIDARRRRRLGARRAARGAPRGRLAADRARRCATSSSRCWPPATRRPPAALAWALERLARHPEVLARVRDGRRRVPGGRRSRRCCACGPCCRSSRRKALRAVRGRRLRRCRPASTSTPCIYLTHRRPDLWADPTAFRPERFLDGAPEPYAFIPFGGGTRRCLGAAFATLEMREVLRAVARALRAAPGPARGRADAAALDHA